MRHPQYPQSNVSKFSGYQSDKYALDDISPTIRTDESLTPNRPPCLTQQTVNKFLQPLTRDLVEVPPRPTIDELPDTVIDNMVQKDKAFWVDKPGVNAYTLHDAYYKYGMTTENVLPPQQDVFPRSYQYDLECVKYRREHACDGLKQSDFYFQKPLAAHCQTCTKTGSDEIRKTEVNSQQKRWRYYPDLTAPLSCEEIRLLMDEYELLCLGVQMQLEQNFTNLTLCNYERVRVGRPFKNEACNWYYKNYPPVKYNCIQRKFSK